MISSSRLFWPVAALALFCLILGAKVISNQLRTSTPAAPPTATLVRAGGVSAPAVARANAPGVGAANSGVAGGLYVNGAGKAVPSTTAGPLPTSSAPTAVPIATIPPPPAPPTVPAYGVVQPAATAQRTMQGLHSNL